MQHNSMEVLELFQAAPNSLFHISHLRGTPSTDSGKMEYMNGVFQSDKNGNSAQIHAYLLWNHL